MGFFARFFGHKQNLPVPSPTEQPAVPVQPRFYDAPIPDTLNLGWYFSPESHQLQMAKIPYKDRATHEYVMGASGVGKTKFLQFQIQQDIKIGNGFCVIDPHGDLIDETMGFLACYHHETQDESIFDRVIIVDPTDPVYTVGFNVLEVFPGVAPIEQAQELIMVFKRIWASAWGPRMEELLRNALIALGQTNLTLGHLSEFLTSQPFRTQVMENVSHPIAKPYFERFDSMSRTAQLQWTEPVTSKVNAFLSDERISHMLSFSKSSFNLRDVMDQQKILLIKLNKGKLRESADLLGSLFMAKLQLAAFSRTDIPEAARVPYYLYIDEFQNFASESFAVVLSEARKYGLRLVLAHQTLEQIPTDLRSIILGNTGIQVYFRMNRQDAQLLAKEAFTYSGYNVKTLQMRGEWIDARFWSLGEEWEHNFAKLQNLQPRHCFIKHKIAGGMLPIQTASIDPAHQVLGMSPAQYAAYLESLPFGKKYLRERSSLTIEPVQTQTAQEVTPQLEEHHRAFLEFIIANPDLPVYRVYKEVGIRAAEVTKIRDSLKQQGLIQDLEVRTGRTTAGRPTKYIIPTFAALELLRREPPTGRGGMIHRAIQHTVAEDALAKGYSAQCENELNNGAIVDVHLEKGQQRIAIEIAVISKPSRELAHIKQCLNAGYDKVVTVFADPRLLEKTNESLTVEFSTEDRAKVQLIPLSKLPGIG
jgi:hypothetical protein